MKIKKDCFMSLFLLFLYSRAHAYKTYGNKLLKQIFQTRSSESVTTQVQ